MVPNKGASKNLELAQTQNAGNFSSTTDVEINV